MKRSDEHELAAICHLCNIIPMWGLIFCSLVWFKSREKSLFVRTQVRQAMYFHGVLIVILILWIIVDLLARVLQRLIVPLGNILHGINVVILVGVLCLFVFFCIRGACQCLSGEPFRYPLVGERVE